MHVSEFIRDSVRDLPAVMSVVELEKEIGGELISCYRVIYDFSCWERLSDRERAIQEEMLLKTLAEVRTKAHNIYQSVVFDMDWTNRWAELRSGNEYRRHGHRRRRDVRDVLYDAFWDRPVQPDVA